LLLISFYATILDFNQESHLINVIPNTDAHSHYAMAALTSIVGRAVSMSDRNYHTLYVHRRRPTILYEKLFLTAFLQEREGKLLGFTSNLDQGHLAFLLTLIVIIGLAGASLRSHVRDNASLRIA
jgi:hypothetical protein